MNRRSWVWLLLYFLYNYSAPQTQDAARPSLWADRVAARLVRPRNLFNKHPTNKFVVCF